MDSSPLTLDIDDLREAFPPAYLERGMTYLRQRRVLTADFKAAQSVATARVAGSGGRVYQCLIQLGREPDGALFVVGQCSCPVGYNCKHVAAALLSLGQQADQRSVSLVGTTQRE